MKSGRQRNKKTKSNFNRQSCEDLVLPIAVSGEVLEAPASLSKEGTGPAIEVIFVELSWISWLSYWIRVEIYFLGGFELALIFPPLNQVNKFPLAIPSIPSAARVSDASMVLSVFTDIFGCNLQLQIVTLLEVVQSKERLIQLLYFWMMISTKLVRLRQGKIFGITKWEVRRCKARRVSFHEIERNAVQWGLVYIDKSFTED